MARRQTPCVLIVEDEPLVSLLLTDLLTQAGFEARACTGAGDVNAIVAEFDPDVALLDINLSVNEGEKIVILGPNGAGKTTLEKILAGILAPEGRFVAFGKPVTQQEINSKNESAAYRRSVGAVFQHIEFRVICATVFDEILFGPLRLGLPREEAKERVEQMLDFCNIHVLNL